MREELEMRQYRLLYEIQHIGAREARLQDIWIMPFPNKYIKNHETNGAVNELKYGKNAYLFHIFFHYILLHSTKYTR